MWCARELVGNEPFALLLPDMLVQNSHGCLAQMIDAARSLGESANVIAVEEVPHERVHMYGVVGVGETKGKLFGITQMVEKPPREKAPSNLIIPGRYILQPEIFGILARQNRGTGGEIQLSDALRQVIREGGRIVAVPLSAGERRHDVGTLESYCAAFLEYALSDDRFGAELRARAAALLDDA